MRLEIRLFGRLQIVDPAADSPPLRQRAQRLLVYLLLHRRTRLRRDQIAFTLWPDLPEDDSLAALRRALSDLRATLPQNAPVHSISPEEWVLASPREIQWNPKSPYWLDVDEYERLGRQMTPTSLHAAVSLYSGDLLMEMEDEWVLAERERLRQLQLEILNRLIAHHRSLRETTQALDLFQSALALDPFAENIYRELISMRYESGDRAGALAVFERLRSQLWEELGVEPMPETRDLAQAISRGESLSPAQAVHPGLTLPAAPATAADARVSLTGREKEQKQLAHGWENAKAGRGGLVILSGEAGVGKSDLIHWLVDEAQLQQGLVLTGSCYQFERTLPYQPIIEALRAAVGMLEHAELLPAYRAILARLVPEFFRTVNLPSGESDGLNDDYRAQLYEAMLQAFLALARSQPLLLAFEHVHWAAESTLDWLTYIVPRLTKQRILVLVTCRTSEIGVDHALKRLEQRFSRSGMVESLRLQPLGREATHQLVASLSGLSGEALDRTAGCLFQESGGNLFFLQELVRGLLETGQIVIVQNTWMGRFVDDALQASSCGASYLPETLRAAILTRVERLRDGPRKFLKTAAVAGDRFHYDVVRKAEKWSDDQALDALDEAVERGFLREEEPPGAYAFIHHLVQEAIYINMSPPRRIYRHREIARAIQSLRPNDDEALAYHFSRAGENEQARHYHLLAADRALQLASLSDAASHFRAALQGWPESDPAGRAEVAARLDRC